MSCELTDSEVAYIDQTIADLHAENAKLRELVRGLANDPDAWDYDYFKRRLRELGVEI